MRFGAELGLQIGQLRSAHAGPGRVAALGHEAGDDAVEGDPVVKAFAGEGRDPLDMARREVGAQLDDDIAARGEGKGEGVGVGHESCSERVRGCRGAM